MASEAPVLRDDYGRKVHVGRTQDGEFCMSITEGLTSVMAVLSGDRLTAVLEAINRTAMPGQVPPVAERPATCGQCQDGLVEAKGCTCGSPGYPDPHERLCGFEPCPNGCWNLLHPEAPPAGRAYPEEARNDH